MSFTFTLRASALRLLIRLLCLAPMIASAIMAGAPPDSPAKRVDPTVSNSSWSGVVSIKTASGTYSGVLVADRYVLTAAHVASGAVATPANLQIILNLSEGKISIPASRIEVFPSYHFPYDDLALVELSTDAPSEALRYVIEDNLIPTGTLITLVGYGASGQGTTGVSEGLNEAIRRVGENALDTYVPNVDNSGRSSAFYLYDFDGPEGNGAMGAGSLGNARETMVAGGDSGSPAFVKNAHENVVIGINTFASTLAPKVGGNRFGQGGGGIRLSDARFISWLRSTSQNTIRMASDPIEESSLLLPIMGGVTTIGALAVLTLRYWKRR